MSGRTDRLMQAFTGLNEGDASLFRDLFAADAQWLGVQSSSIDGATPI